MARVIGSASISALLGMLSGPVLFLLFSVLMHLFSSWVLNGFSSCDLVLFFGYGVIY